MTAGIHALNVGHSGVVWIIDRAVVAILAVSSWLSITVGIVHAISVLVRVHSRRVVAWVVAWVAICTHCTSATNRAVLTASWRAQDTVVGMCFHMLLKVLRTFERLATEVTFVRL